MVSRNVPSSGGGEVVSRNRPSVRRRRPWSSSQANRGSDQYRWSAPNGVWRSRMGRCKHDRMPRAATVGDRPGPTGRLVASSTRRNRRGLTGPRPHGNHSDGRVEGMSAPGTRLPDSPGSGRRATTRMPSGPTECSIEISAQVESRTRSSPSSSSRCAGQSPACCDNRSTAALSRPPAPLRCITIRSAFRSRCPDGSPPRDGRPPVVPTGELWLPTRTSGDKMAG
jgi:hypothetical protein